MHPPHNTHLQLHLITTATLLLLTSSQQTPLCNFNGLSNGTFIVSTTCTINQTITLDAVQTYGEQLYDGPPIDGSNVGVPWSIEATWVCPVGVTRVNVVAVGGGAGGKYTGGIGGSGGGLAWANNVQVAPGLSYAVVAGRGGHGRIGGAGGDSSFGGIIVANGGTQTQGGCFTTIAGGGGGCGGQGSDADVFWWAEGSGGGAGGYFGNGGNAGYSAPNGGGGAGGGMCPGNAADDQRKAGGGGVGLSGAGESGKTFLPSGGVSTGSTVSICKNPDGGGGGSGGEAGSAGSTDAAATASVVQLFSEGGAGGKYGGGGGGGNGGGLPNYKTNNGVDNGGSGGMGAVKITWLLAKGYLNITGASSAAPFSKIMFDGTGRLFVVPAGQSLFLSYLVLSGGQVLSTTRDVGGFILGVGPFSKISLNAVKMVGSKPTINAFSGGAIAVLEGVALTIQSSTFQNFQTRSGGGAIRIEKASAERVVLETHNSVDIEIPNDATSLKMKLTCSIPSVARTNGLIEFKNAAKEIIYRGPFPGQYCDNWPHSLRKLKEVAVVGCSSCFTVLVFVKTSKIFFHNAFFPCSNPDQRAFLKEIQHHFVY